MEIVRQAIRSEIVVAIHINEIPGIVNGDDALEALQTLLRTEALKQLNAMETPTP